jgi:hypothetical protein
MVYKVLTNAQVDQFMELGWIKIEGAIRARRPLTRKTLYGKTLNCKAFAGTTRRLGPARSFT